MRNKEQAVKKLIEFKSIIEKKTEDKIKSVQSDNGIEYDNQKLRYFLKKEGTHHRLSVSHTPKQNGVAERKNQTLMQTVRCMQTSYEKWIGLAL